MTAQPLDSPPGAPIPWARLVRRLLPATAALLLALLIRHLAIEPPEIAHACDPAPWSGWCAARSVLIRSFSTQGLGWLSLVAGVAATFSRRTASAQVALAAGAAGLVLYCFEPSAVGALLGALALNRADDRGR